MDRSKAESMLTDARAELATAESAVLYLRQVVSGLEGLLKTSPAVIAPIFSATGPELPVERADSDASPTASAVDGEQQHSYPRTPDAVMRILQARPNKPMSFKEMWSEMQAQDLINPSIKSGRNAYTNAANRLVSDAKVPVVRDEVGRYVFLTMPASDYLTSRGNGEAPANGTPGAPQLMAVTS